MQGVKKCPIDGFNMEADTSELPPAPPGWVYFDYTFEPGLAHAIVMDIPRDSYHWADIKRKAPGAVDMYSSIMISGQWQDQTLERGYYEHPIRFDSHGDITHGVMRLLACSAAGRSFRAVVLAPAWMKESMESWVL